jgi:hypothetical protein
MVVIRNLVTFDSLGSHEIFHHLLHPVGLRLMHTGNRHQAQLHLLNIEGSFVGSGTWGCIKRN